MKDLSGKEPPLGEFCLPPSLDPRSEHNVSCRIYMHSSGSPELVMKKSRVGSLYIHQSS